MMAEELPVQHFETDNLLFRGLGQGDISEIFHLYSDSQVTQLDYSEPMKDIKEAEYFITEAKNSYKNPHILLWGVEQKISRKIIGTCGYKNWDRISHHAEIGGNLSSDFWGKGIATEGLRALLEYGFTKMNTSIKKTKIQVFLSLNFGFF